MSKAQARRQGTKDGAIRCKRFNQILEVILSTFRSAQNSDQLNQVTLQLADWVKVVNLKVPVALIIGDLQGADQLVGRIATDIEATCNIWSTANQFIQEPISVEK